MADECKTPVTADALAAYLGVDDDADAMTAANLWAAAQAANAYLRGALGLADEGGYADPRALAVGLAFAADLYDNRSYADESAKASGAVRRMVCDLSFQLRCEAMSG